MLHLHLLVSFSISFSFSFFKMVFVNFGLTWKKQKNTLANSVTFSNKYVFWKLLKKSNSADAEKVY